MILHAFRRYHRRFQDLYSVRQGYVEVSVRQEFYAEGDFFFAVGLEVDAVFPSRQGYFERAVLAASFVGGGVVVKYYRSGERQAGFHFRNCSGYGYLSFSVAVAYDIDLIPVGGCDRGVFVFFASGVGFLVKISVRQAQAFRFCPFNYFDVCRRSVCSLKLFRLCLKIGETGCGCQFYCGPFANSLYGSFFQGIELFFLAEVVGYVFLVVGVYVADVRAIVVVGVCPVHLFNLAEHWSVSVFDHLKIAFWGIFVSYVVKVYKEPAAQPGILDILSVKDDGGDVVGISAQELHPTGVYVKEDVAVELAVVFHLSFLKRL